MFHISVVKLIVCVSVCVCVYEVQMGIGHQLQIDPDLGFGMDIIKVFHEMSLSRERDIT